MLYIHIPFCASHCSYCAFYSTTSTELLTTYYTTLLQEIRYSHLLHGDSNTPIQSIFFGGGTPSFVPAEYIATILEELQKQYSFSDTIEITLEANPESITKEKATIWYQSGINRVSVGCQSMIPETLHLLQRIHSVEGIYTAIDILRESAFYNISVDMIWGHCNHTVERWLYELKSILSLEIQHLSCYSLTIEENTLLAEQYTLHTMLPTEEELCSLYFAGKNFLEEHGYMQYETSNFAKVGYECKHNIGYWNDIPYYGYGPSASSYNGKARYKHPSSIQAWSSCITQCCKKKKELPHKEIRTIENIYTEYLLLGLRQTKGISLTTINTYCSIPFEIYYKTQLEALITDGLLIYNNDTLCVTPKGMLVVDAIIREFIDIPQ